MKLNSFQLKCIAVVSMLIDHTGAILFPQYLIFRYIGRLAFPIFAFLLVEGFFHTRNIEAYIFRMGIFALVSEIPYDLAFRGCLLEFTHQNVFFTLGCGLFMLYLIQRTGPIWIKSIWVLCGLFAGAYLGMDYSYRGIVLILIYYLMQKKGRIKHLIGALWNVIFYTHSVPTLTQFPIQYAGMISSVLLSLYDGERGPKVKYAFYVFYPTHLLILYGISRLVV